MEYRDPIHISARRLPLTYRAMLQQQPGTDFSAFSRIAKERGDTREFADKLASIGSAIRLRAGETLHVEGEAANKCYEVTSGLLKEYNTLSDGSCHIADFRFRGDMVGLPCSGINQHTVEAVGDSSLISYPANRFLKTVTEMPALSQWFTQRLLGDLERARANGLALSRLNAMERVARFLLTLCRAEDVLAGLDGVVAIPMSRQDMADHLGLTIETVCRCLTALKRNGLITLPTPHGFTIPDKAILAALAAREDMAAA